MAHYAKLDIENNVIAINVLNNQDNINSLGVEDESIGIEFLTKQSGWPLWKKVSYNTRFNQYYNIDGTLGDQSKAFRGNYPGVGYIYNAEHDIFIAKKPYNSWILNIEKAKFEAPVAEPVTETDGIPDQDTWNESTVSWDKIINPTYNPLIKE